jgi:hypothetical protein
LLFPLDTRFGNDNLASVSEPRNIVQLIKCMNVPMLLVDVEAKHPQTQSQSTLHSELPMRILHLSVIMLGAGLLVASPSFAQTSPQKQKTDGDSPTMVGPASGASKQRTDGDSPTVVGPASGAYKQRTDGGSPTVVGSASGASKQRTDGDSPTVIGPASGAYKQKTQSFSHSDGSPAGAMKQN